jgi:hypothetical protein
MPQAFNEGIAMHDETDELSQRVDERLSEMVRHITDARTAFVSGGASHINRTVEMRLEQVRSRTVARSAQFQNERKRVNSRVKKTLAKAREQVEGWRESGQTQKLRQHADQSEQYALAAILDANEAIDRALIAAMESLVAHSKTDKATRQS